MSFFLLPPVSYQTQEKLKKDMEQKKARSRRKSELRSKFDKSSVASSAQSIHSHSSAAGGRPSLNRNLSSTKTNKSFLSGRSSTSSDCQSLVSDINLLNLMDNDNVSTTSSLFSKSIHHSKDSKTMNYSYSSELNDILKFNSDEKKKKYRHHQKVAANSIASPEISIREEEAIEEERERELHSHGDATTDMFQARPGLSRVYSNVSSIFSTKDYDTASSTPFLEQVPSTVSSVKTKTFASRFKKRMLSS